MGFLDVIITPSFQAACQVITLEANIKNIEENKGKWQERFEEYEEKMNNDKERLAKRS